MSFAPKKELGQHFLVDENILRVIERLAALDGEDVVLEIGPGRGALTRFLAARVRHVHAVEVDTALEPRLRDIPRTDLHWGDALRLDLGGLEPPPRKLVSNLPYNVATPLVIESIDRLPAIDRWCVMVQREVADRFFARAGTKAYGAVSVLLQLATERTGFHAVSREVFRPRPNVDSALVAFRRTAPRIEPHVKRVVVGAFAHRRKTIANSLALAGVASREDAAGALAAVGREATARAEALAPGEFPALARALAVEEHRRRLAPLLPGVNVEPTGSATVDDLDPEDLDLVALVDDVAAAAASVGSAYPPLHREQWRDDWAAFRDPGPPQVDLVLTRAGTRGEAHHLGAWHLLARDRALLDEYRALKRTPDDYEARKRAFFERIVALLDP